MTDEILRCFFAFVTGGVFCAVAQVLIDRTRLTPARILVFYVVAGVVLTAVGVYEPLKRFAGGGATTPLTGFGYTLATGVKRAVDETGTAGILTGGVSAAAAGITAVLFFSFIAALIFGSKPKR